MQSSKILFLIVLFIANISLTCLAFEDAIIAVVNDELITLKDLKYYIHSTYVSLVSEGRDDEQLKEIMADLEINGINKLIEEKLILSKANEIGLEIREKLITERLQDIKNNYPSEQAFLDALDKNGVTITDLRDKILNQLKVQYVIEHEVEPKIHINPQEITNFYNKNTDSFQFDERVNLGSIYIAFADDKLKAKERAQEALKLVQEGEDFLNIAQQYSDTPSIGIIAKGQLLADIEDAVFNLKEGEVSSLLEVDSGFYIFKLIEKIPAGIASLEEAKDSIKNFLYRQKFQEEFETWLNKLKKNAYIEIKK